MDRRQLTMALQSAADAMKAPTEEREQRSARLALSKTLRMDPFDGASEYDFVDASRDKADAVGSAAERVALTCLSGEERRALVDLLRLARSLNDGRSLNVSQDVVWLFKVALGQCSRSFDWTKIASFDLAGAHLESQPRNIRPSLTFRLPILG